MSGLLESLIRATGSAPVSRRVDFAFVRAPPPRALIINTLPADTQSLLIVGTVPAETEEARVNAAIDARRAADTPIIIYGRCAADESPERKVRQMLALGFVDVYVYTGGMFEWLLLREVFGREQFACVGADARRTAVDVLSYGGVR